MPEERLAEAVERGGDVVERARADVAAIVSQESSIRLNGSPTMAETQTGPHEAERVSTAASVMAWQKGMAGASGAALGRPRACHRVCGSTADATDAKMGRHRPRPIPDVGGRGGLVQT